MHFLLKVDSKFYAERDAESLFMRLNFLQLTDSKKTNSWFWGTREDRFEIIRPHKNGFELEERTYNQKGIKVRAVATMKTSGVGTEISLQIRPVKWSLYLQLFVMAAMFSFLTYFMWSLCGPVCLILIPFFYLFILFGFMVRVWDIENIIIHKICEKRVRKIQS